METRQSAFILYHDTAARALALDPCPSIAPFVNVRVPYMSPAALPRHLYCQDVAGHTSIAPSAGTFPHVACNAESPPILCIGSSEEPFAFPPHIGVSIPRARRRLPLVSQAALLPLSSDQNGTLSNSPSLGRPGVEERPSLLSAHSHRRRRLGVLKDVPTAARRV